MQSSTHYGALRKKPVVLSLTVSIGLVATLQTIPALILRLIRETMQRHRFLERLKPSCIHTLKVVWRVQPTSMLALEQKFRGTFGVFQTSNGQLSSLDRQAMGIRQV